MSKQGSSHLISLHEDGLYLLNLNERTSSKLDLPFTLPDQTEQGQTKPDQTEQDQTEQDPTEQDQTKQDQTEPDQTEQDPTEQDPTEPDQTKPDQTQQDPTKPDQTEPVVILHCRGMLCLTLKGNKELAIWKPGSKEFKIIPMVQPGAGQTTNPLGFGYDKASDDYKIVTVIDYKTHIYSFKEKSWRESVPDTSLDRKFKNRSGTVAGNCMYWIADRSHSEVNSILCFDFVKEEYQEWDHVTDIKMGSWVGVSREEFRLIDYYPFLESNDLYVWSYDNSENLGKWSSGPRINVKKSFKGLKEIDVGFACIARNDEVFVVVKGGGNGEEDKVMVYDEGQGKLIEVSFGSSLKGFRCMSNYICH